MNVNETLYNIAQHYEMFENDISLVDLVNTILVYHDARDLYFADHPLKNREFFIHLLDTLGIHSFDSCERLKYLFVTKKDESFVKDVNSSDSSFGKALGFFCYDHDDYSDNSIDRYSISIILSKENKEITTEVCVKERMQLDKINTYYTKKVDAFNNVLIHYGFKVHHTIELIEGADTRIGFVLDNNRKEINKRKKDYDSDLENYFTEESRFIKNDSINRLFTPFKIIYIWFVHPNSKEMSKFYLSNYDNPMFSKWCLAFEEKIIDMCKTLQEYDTIPTTEVNDEKDIDDDIKRRRRTFVLQHIFREGCNFQHAADSIILHAKEFMKDFEEYFTPRSIFYSILKRRDEKTLRSYIFVFYVIYLVMTTTNKRSKKFIDSLKDDEKKFTSFEHSLLYFEGNVIDLFVSQYKRITPIYDGWKIIQLKRRWIQWKNLAYYKFSL
jgi:hypothetical protein